MAKPTLSDKVILIDLDLADVNVFNTNDLHTNGQFATTDVGTAFIGFKSVGVDISTGTMKVSLINLDDNSKIQRSIVVDELDNYDDTLKTFFYQVREAEIVHAGRWKGQITFTDVFGKTLTSRKFRFEISGHIFDKDDAPLVDVDDVTAFLSSVTAIYDDLNNFLTYAEGAVSGKMDKATNQAEATVGQFLSSNGDGTVTFVDNEGGSGSSEAAIYITNQIQNPLFENGTDGWTAENATLSSELHEWGAWNQFVITPTVGAGETVRVKTPVTSLDGLQTNYWLSFAFMSEKANGILQAGLGMGLEYLNLEYDNQFVAFQFRTAAFELNADFIIEYKLPDDWVIGDTLSLYGVVAINLTDDFGDDTSRYPTDNNFNMVLSRYTVGTFEGTAAFATLKDMYFDKMDKRVPNWTTLALNESMTTIGYPFQTDPMYRIFADKLEFRMAVTMPVSSYGQTIATLPFFATPHVDYRYPVVMDDEVGILEITTSGLIRIVKGKTGVENVNVYANLTILSANIFSI